MSAELRTVRVTGLPVNISVNRLNDKLQIHFLRKKNGGGEISSVTVSRETPGTAFITFEESEVALRLAQRGKQLFKVNEKTYDITIHLHQEEEMDVDKVMLCMSVVMDHRKLPGGRNTLLSLHERFPGVRLIVDEQKDICTLKGRYSEVQSLCRTVLSSLEKQDQSSGVISHPKKTYESPPEESTTPHLGANEDLGVIKHSKLGEDLDEDLDSKSWKSGPPPIYGDTALTPSYSDHASHIAPLMEDKWLLIGAPDIESPFEDLSLIVDSDIFHYIHKHCSKEYESILARHRVEVLDVTCDDITTLYLKPKRVLAEYDVHSAQKAHTDLAHLYQQKESQLRKEHVYKHGVPEKELRDSLESLRKRLPRLMIDEKGGNVYMVGYKSDVSEAKQFLGDTRGFGMEKEIQLDHLFVPSAPPETSGVLQDLFMPKKDFQKGNSGDNCSQIRHSSVERRHFGDHSPTGQLTFPQSLTIESSKDDLFSLGKNEASYDRRDLKGTDSGRWYDRNKDTDSLFKPSASAPNSILDIDAKFLNSSDFISAEAQLPKQSGSSESQSKTGKGSKTKQTGKEHKMAANFSRDMTSKDLTSSKSDEKAFTNERKVYEIGLAHSLPLIKPSASTSLDQNSSHGAENANTSTDKTDIRGTESSVFGHFSFNKKPTMTPGSVTGDQDVKGSPTGSTLRRSSSFSDKVLKGEEKTQVAVDVSSGESGNFQREVFAMDLALSFRLWLYLTSVYKTEIENLTSDLQVKEKYDKEDITLCMRSINSAKVSECHRGLKSLVVKAGMDFDSRTITLAEIGVSDNKDKILQDFCLSMKQQYKMVKILVMSSDVMILGPKPVCDEVKDAMIKIVRKGGNDEYSNSNNKQSPKATDLKLRSVRDQSGTSAIPHPDITMKHPSKMFDSTVDYSSKQPPQVSANQREQDHENGELNKIKGGHLVESLNKKYPTMIQRNGETINNKNGETSSGISVTSATEDEAQVNNRDQHSTNKETFPQQMDSGDHINDSLGSPEDSKPKIRQKTLPSQASGNQTSCYVCGKDSSTVKQTACGFRFCPECDRNNHKNCIICSNVGIKGTMSVQESIITIPGFNRDTTLKIVYDIPDGIQGEDHPFPGAPFKGNRFEAYLPHNKATKMLLPLLDKAFQKGLTFTVKASDNSGSTEGRVVWGNIPHKTKTEGGMAMNGYPDSNYIKRLEEALKAAGVGEETLIP